MTQASESTTTAKSVTFRPCRLSGINVTARAELKRAGFNVQEGRPSGNRFPTIVVDGRTYVGLSGISKYAQSCAQTRES
jgi:hypothetical protein